MIAVCVTAHAYARSFFNFFFFDHRATATLRALALRSPADSFAAEPFPLQPAEPAQSHRRRILRFLRHASLMP